MAISTENILLIGSILIFISLLAGKTSFKFGVPTLIFFLGIGMLAGSEGIGKIYFDDPQKAQFIGIVALNFILFSGGLDTNWQAIRPVLWQGLSLSTLGVFLTAASVGVFVHLVTDFCLYEGLLLGAIVSSTDAAAVFSILRSKNIALKNQLRPMLELESGSNDPMAYFLTIAFMGLVLNPQSSVLSIIPLFLQQILIGAAMGFLFGYLGKVTINRIKLGFEGLYPVLVISLMFFNFSFTDFVGGNGFLSIYICAVYLGNQDFIHKKSVLQAFDGFAWLMEIVLFLTLGLLVFPSQVVPVMGIGFVIAIFLIFVARPVGVMLALLFSKASIKSKAFVSWVGLRGAVPIVFATYPLLNGVEKSQMIFNMVFFISLTSILVQGTSLSKMASWLNLTLPQDLKPKRPNEILLSDEAKEKMMEIEVDPKGEAVGKKIVELGFPPSTIIGLIKRDGKYLTPNGATILLANDLLMILTDQEDGLAKVQEILSRPNMDLGKDAPLHQ
ncbi:potassium/proton antiporter [Pararhodonellum marinum]|uniref:potassium/proton antiporter n=1 Tax=Pararhodonellum marinum TaxID=2755358 RepID=UPI00188F8850|nr:potassium/proton antiporter [Pararhodonellum marinum]